MTGFVDTLKDDIAYVENMFNHSATTTSNGMPTASPEAINAAAVSDFAHPATNKFLDFINPSSALFPLLVLAGGAIVYMLWRHK